jgi:plastocyanin
MSVRPRHVLASVLAMTALILVVGAPAPWPNGEAAQTTVGVGAGGSDAFGPTDIAVAQGDTVVWTWQSGTHDVTSTSPEAFASGKLSTGSFSHTFPAAGTFTYICSLHGGMTGKVTVTAAATPAAPAPAATPAPAAPAPTAAAPADPATGAQSGTAAHPGAAAQPGTARPDAATAAAGPAPKMTRVRVVATDLRFSLNKPATIVAVAAVKSKRRLELAAAPESAGSGRLPLALHVLRPGRYTVVIRATDAAGKRSPAVRVHVKVTWRLRYRALAARKAALSNKAQTAPSTGAPVVTPATPAVPSAPAGPALAPVITVPPAVTPVIPNAPQAPVAPGSSDDGDHSGSGKSGKDS